MNEKGETGQRHSDGQNDDDVLSKLIRHTRPLHACRTVHTQADNSVAFEQTRHFQCHFCIKDDVSNHLNDIRAQNVCVCVSTSSPKQ